MSEPILQYNLQGERVSIGYTCVKDSGEKETFENGAWRDTQVGKGRYDLIPYDCLERVAVHYENGARKYGDHNWQKGMKSTRYFSSAIRHLSKYMLGSRDEDHLSAAIWNIMAIMWNEIHMSDYHDIKGEQYKNE